MKRNVNKGKGKVGKLKDVRRNARKERRKEGGM